MEKLREELNAKEAVEAIKTEEISNKSKNISTLNDHVEKLRTELLTAQSQLREQRTSTKEAASEAAVLKDALEKKCEEVKNKEKEAEEVEI